MIPLRHDETVPLYQFEAVLWLRCFRHTELLQQLLAKFRFSELEIAAYRNNWAQWLRPNSARSDDGQNDANPYGTGTI
jgi:hypothetical protein